MKRIGVLICILFILGTTNAQTWCAPGAEWHYRVLMPFYVNYQDGYMKVSVTGTVNNGSNLIYSLSGTFYGQLYPQGSPTTTLNYFNINIYEQNQVVYIYPIDTLVNLNASIGDKWRCSRFGSNTSGNPCIRPYLTVIDTGHVFINGHSLKKISVIHSSYPLTSFDIIEKIGCLYGFMYPYYSCEDHGWSLGRFACYSDNSFPLYQPPGYTLPCDFTTVGLGEYNVVDSDFKVYPNPGSDKICISFPEMWNGKNMNLVVRDALGKKVKEQEFTETHEFDFGEHPAGFYQIELISGNQILACRKWVKVEH